MEQIKPKVSVIVPVYQVIQYLDTCIQSILNQTFADYELVLVDDGSSDGSGERCDEWTALDTRISVIHQDNAGLSAARNSGLLKCSGDYVLFVDSDDQIKPSLLESAIAQIDATGSDICFYKYVIQRDDGTTLPYKESANFPQVSVCTPTKALEYMYSQNIHNFAWAHLAKTSLYKHIVFPVGKTMEDLATTSCLVSRATRVSFLPEELYLYRKRNRSITSHWSHRLTLDTISAFEAIESELTTLPSQTRQLELNYKIKMLFYCLMMEYRLPPCDARANAIKAVTTGIMSAASSCERNSLSGVNKVKCALSRTGLVRIVAKMRSE